MASILSQLFVMILLTISVCIGVQRLSSLREVTSLLTSSRALHHLILRCHQDALRNKHRQLIRFDRQTQSFSNSYQQERVLIPVHVNAQLQSSVENAIECRHTGTLSPASIRLETALSSCTISIALRGRVREDCEALH